MCDAAKPRNPVDWIKKNLLVINKEGKRNPTYLAHVLLIIIVLGGSSALYGFAYLRTWTLVKDSKVCPDSMDKPVHVATTGSGHQGNQKAQPDSNVKEFPPVITSIESNIETIEVAGRGNPVLASQKERLKEQVYQLQLARIRSCYISMFFLAHRNATLTLGTATGIVALASLAFLSKEGWKGSNNAIINIGVTSGLVLFGAWTYGQLYGQEVNFTAHNDNYIIATRLLNKVASAVATRNIVFAEDGASEASRLSLGNSADMAVLLQRLDRELVQLEAPEFGGDSSFVRGAAERVNSFIQPTTEDADPNGEES
jgi:hypothetical protein